MSEDNAISQRHLVNPVSLRNCAIQISDGAHQILDLSFLRVVVQETEGMAFEEGALLNARFVLERHQFDVELRFRAKGRGWLRFEFERMVPSVQAHLRSFLSAKKVGESILVDAIGEGVSHYHGLNECELWSDPKGGILFTYLDPQDPKMQFVVRVADQNASLRVGRMSRAEFIELSDVDGELPLGSLTDREIYAKLGECRDIVTNFRPSGPEECALKQRLLKLVSDALYSTSNRVNMWVPRTPKTTPIPNEGVGLS